MRITFDFDSDELNYRDAAKAIKQTLKHYRQLIATDHSGNLLPEDSGNVWLDGAKIGAFVVSTPDEEPVLTFLPPQACERCGEMKVNNHACPDAFQGGE